ncbi:putative SET domain, tetratricopeptide-like helical domain superfamily [Septoria linicola]|nr:putative SET domain, tetratricopeptide-like helical domain superfamily [Septoria linicola]
MDDLGSFLQNTGNIFRVGPGNLKDMFQAPSIKQPFVDGPPKLQRHHPPSTHSHGFEPTEITFAELNKGELNHHYKGRITYLRITQVKPHCGAIFDVVDQNGTSGEVWSLIASPIGPAAIPIDTIISIRDPVYGKEEILGRPAICLHHPSDCRRVSRFSSLARDMFPHQALKFDKTSWLEVVTKMCISGHHRDGVDLCNLVLEHDEADIGREIQCLLKRAFCYSQLGAHAAAMADCARILKITPQNLPALRLVLSAGFKVGLPFRATEYAKQLSQITPTTSQPLLGRAQIFEKQATGHYDFKALAHASRNNATCEQTCYFTGNVGVHASPLGGRGMFATQNIERGDLLLCEHAVALADRLASSDSGIRNVLLDEKTSARVFDLLQKVARKAMLSGLDDSGQLEEFKLQDQIFDLHSDHPFDAPMDDHNIPFNAYRALSILKHNMHTVFPGSTSMHHDLSDPANKVPSDDPVPTAKDQIPGLWLKASMFNHSCLPNVTWSWIGDLFIARADRAIAADEELTIAYVPNTYAHERRSRILQSHNSFECYCPLCVADKNTSDVDKAARLKVQDMLRQKFARIAKNNSAGRTTVEESVKDFIKSYDYSAYRGLPKVGLGDVFFQLAHMYLGGDIDKWHLTTPGSLRKAQECLIAVLEVGSKIYFLADDITGYCELLLVEHSQPKIAGILALMGLAELACISKEVVKCRAFKACAKGVYGIVYGESDTFEEKHRSYKCFREPAVRGERPGNEEWDAKVEEAKRMEGKVLGWLL